MGRRKRHTPEEIIRKLREAERLQAEGLTIAQVCQQLETTEQTLYRWRSQYGGMKADDMKELKTLREENRRLKKAVADLTLDVQGLKEIAKGNW